MNTMGDHGVIRKTVEDEAKSVVRPADESIVRPSLEGGVVVCRGRVNLGGEDAASAVAAAAASVATATAHALSSEAARPLTH